MTHRRRAASPFGALWTTLRRSAARRVPLPPPVPTRGAPRLTVDAAGRLRCVACALCAAACPTACIQIEAGPPPWDEAVPADGVTDLSRARWPERFDLDLSRCLLCGLCAAACPVGAITLQGTPAVGAGSRRADLLRTREQLL